MPAEDAVAARRMRAQITRRYVDASMLHVRVVHGTVYIQGIVRPLRTHKDIDMDQEIEMICRILRGQPGVREVVWEASQRI
jgi:hypothetical protein